MKSNKDSKKSVVVTCQGAAMLDLNDLEPLQGNLKSLSVENFERLKASILKHGFTFPFSVWRDGDTNYVLDGHQRDRVLEKMREEGYVIPPLPVVYIEASSKKQAAEKILLNSSQYGKMSEETLYEFIHAFELEDGWAETSAILDLPRIDVSEFTKGWMKENINAEASMDVEEKDFSCPRCGFAARK